MKIRSVDLFCGVGGLTCGVRSAGIEVVAGYDIDLSSKLAYEANNPGSEFILRDVSAVRNGELAAYFPVDTDIRVLMGCAPCQPFSTYNRLPKSAPARSAKMNLLATFGALVEDVTPDIVSIENVPNLTKESVFVQFVEMLSRLNYHVQWQILNTASYGVPQTRRRLVLLASRLGPISIPAPTHSTENFRTVSETIGDLPRIGAGETSHSDNLHRSRRLTTVNLNRIRASKPGGSWKDWPEQLLPNAYKKPSGKSYTSVYGRMQWNSPSPTITTQFIGYGSGRFGHPEQDRALSLREGALLQTFPRNYVFVPPEAGNDYHMQPIAIQIGNAVPPQLGKVLGHAISDHVSSL